MVKVTAKNETIAKLIKHPNGKSFKDDGTAEWPDDQFTKRRLRDGDITVEAAPPPPEGDAMRSKSGKPATPLPPPPKS